MRLMALSLALLLSAPVFAAAAPAADTSKKNIVEIATAAGSFNTLTTALQKAELVETLQGEGPFTVFAPTDEAFKALPEGALEGLLQNPKALKQVLLYHVVPGKVTAEKVVKLDSAKTAGGAKVKISTEGQTVMINNAKVVKADIMASNGVIHVIDKVLLPPTGEKTGATAREQLMEAIAARVAEETVTMVALADKKDIVDTAVAAGSFSTLVTAVKEAGLVETLKSEGPFTVFAPTDEAFKALPEGALDALLKNKEALKGVLLYHVVPGKVTAKEVTKLKEAKTAVGATVMISTKDDTVMINNAKVVKADVMASNGVIHVIDKVLLPMKK